MVDRAVTPAPMLVSPMEPSSFYSLGTISSEPEQYGVDFMWDSPMGTVGVQRKEFPADFLGSKQDGRLNKEYRQMQGLANRFLLLEGRGNWTSDGWLAVPVHGNQSSRSRRWHKFQHRNYLNSVQVHKGVGIITTDNIHDTREYLVALKLWTEKPEHLSLERMPAARSDSYWGDVSNYDFQLHVLTAFPIIGPKIAANLIEFFGGLPFTLNATVEQLMMVDGVGKTRAQMIWDMFHKLEAKDG